MSFFTVQIDEIQGGHTALHIACHEGHCDVIRELLDRGASRNALVTNYINLRLNLWNKDALYTNKINRL